MAGRSNRARTSTTLFDTYIPQCVWLNEHLEYWLISPFRSFSGLPDLEYTVWVINMRLLKLKVEVEGSKRVSVEEVLGELIEL